MALILALAANAAAGANRFQPPDLAKADEEFQKRFGKEIFNVEFLVANVLGETRSAVRDAEEEVSERLEDDRNAAGSVILEPGAVRGAHTVIIININEGDSIAIDR